MLSNHMNSCVHKANHISFDDIELIVAAANIAGFLEANNKISVSSDTELTEFILKTLEKYQSKHEISMSFNEFIVDALLKEFSCNF